MNKNVIKNGNKAFLEGSYLEAIEYYKRLEYGNKILNNIVNLNIEFARKKLLEKNKNYSKAKIVFISHDASMTGAPAVLLETVKWISNNSDFEISILIGGTYLDRVESFSKIAKTLLINDDIGKKQLNDFLGENIDLIFASTIVSAPIIENLINLYPYAKVISHIHEREGVLRHFESYTQYIILKSNAIITVDEEIVNSLRFRGLKRTCDLSIISDFVKEDLNKIKDEESIPTIWGCGTIEDRKGFDLFCQTIAKLKIKSNLSFKAAWIGSSNNHIEPNKSLGMYEVIADIKMIGKVDDPATYYKKNDIFFMSSREDPFPLVCMEAAQRQLAILSFDERAGSSAKWIKESEGGLVCRYLDTDDAAFCLELLIKDSGMRNIMGKNAKKYINQKHVANIKVPEIFNIINRSLLSEGDLIAIKKILIISFGPLPITSGSVVEGGGLRCWGLANGFSKLDCDISVAYPSWYGGDIDIYKNINILKWNDISDLKEIIKNYSHIIVSYCYGNYSVEIKNSLSSDQRLILDCYVPIHVEVSARSSKKLIDEYQSFESDRKSWEEVLRSGDYLLCASDQQKNYYFGILYGLGLLNPINYRNSDNIIVAPFGIHGEYNLSKIKPISNHFDKNPNSIKILWFGGIYPWFDINVLIESVKILRAKHNITLTIVGAKNPFNNHPDFVEIAQNIIKIADDEDNKDFLYVADWVPYEDRFAWFADCDNVITINKDGIENYFAWRTRLLDYLESSTSFLTNGGDPLSEELISLGLGRRINCESQEDLIDSLDFLISSNSKVLIDENMLNKMKIKYNWKKICSVILEKIQ
jgi:hypothetical protein